MQFPLRCQLSVLSPNKSIVNIIDIQYKLKKMNFAYKYEYSTHNANLVIFGHEIQNFHPCCSIHFKHEKELRVIYAFNHRSKEVVLGIQSQTLRFDKAEYGSVFRIKSFSFSYTTFQSSNFSCNVVFVQLNYMYTYTHFHAFHAFNIIISIQQILK